MSDTNFTIEQIIEKYLAIREDIDRINAETKAKLEPLNKAMDGIESYLMAVSNKTGQTQFGTPNGTAFTTTANQCSVPDFELTKRFIVRRGLEALILRLTGEPPTPEVLEDAISVVMNEGEWQLLNKAVNKTAVGDYIEQNEGIPPPGTKWTSMKVIQVRKKTNKNIKEAA